MKRLLIFIACCQSSILFGQVSAESELFISLKAQDSIFFERGFNQCDLEYLESVVADDLRFYHDQSGVQDRKVFFENTKKYICGSNTQKPIRKVEESSLVVYPLYQNGNLYGAIQHGEHHFYIQEKGKEDVYTSSAKFTHVWLLENEVWKLSEVLSYDHRN
ncbi:MAG: nuclear transport factor 2 family protein [Cyclobacteriaceae bacterium]|nr:nuclear transport factor 2 family protein [Cyclobacteriaceae bacterium SS2]